MRLHQHLQPNNANVLRCATCRQETPIALAHVYRLLEDLLDQVSQHGAPFSTSKLAAAAALAHSGLLHTAGMPLAPLCSNLASGTQQMDGQHADEAEARGWLRAHLRAWALAVVLLQDEDVDVRYAGLLDTLSPLSHQSCCQMNCGSSITYGTFSCAATLR